MTMLASSMLCVFLGLGGAGLCAAQNPDNGVPAKDIDSRIEESVKDTLRANQGLQWEIRDSRRLGQAISELVFETRIGLRLVVLTTRLEFMQSGQDAEARLNFIARATSEGGKAVAGVGEAAFIWSSAGFASVRFRQGSVVAVVTVADDQSTDDQSATVTAFAQDVALGIDNAD